MAVSVAAEKWNRPWYTSYSGEAAAEAKNTSRNSPASTQKAPALGNVTRIDHTASCNLAGPALFAGGPVWRVLRAGRLGLLVRDEWSRAGGRPAPLGRTPVARAKGLMGA